MRRLRDLPLPSQLLLMMLSVTLAALGAGLSVVTVLDLRSFRRDLLADASLRAKMAAEYSVADLAFGYRAEAAADLARLSLYSDIDRAALYDSGGALFAVYARGGRAAGLPAALSPGVARDGKSFKDGRLEIFEPAVYNGVRYGTLYLGVSTAQHARRVKDRLILAAALALGVALLVFLVASRVQRLVSQPVLKLAALARRVSAEGAYSLRTGIEKRGDEIGALADGFDSMLAGLESRSRERDEAEAALKRAQAELERRVAERTEQLTVANRELEAFTYSASHDLRAPLRRIDGFSSLLEQQGEEALTQEERRDYLTRIRAGCRLMAGTIDSLLRLSHITRHVVEIADVDLAALARGAVDRLREAEPSRGVSFKAVGAAQVAGDPVLLAEVMENLLSNAWKFTGKTPDAAIEFGFSDKPGGRVYFVKDNGSGFSMEYAGKLFRPFQRLHSPSEFPGTGIGLCTVQRIIERHGGTIWVESGEGLGATFYFTVPGRSSGLRAA